jgi:hypothetical protein
MFARPEDWQIAFYKQQATLFTLLPYANSACQTPPQLSATWKRIVSIITQKNSKCLMTTIYYNRKLHLQSLQFRIIINTSHHVGQIITSCSQVHGAYILSNPYDRYWAYVTGLNLPGCGVNHTLHLAPRFKKEYSHTSTNPSVLSRNVTSGLYFYV